ncbi:MAG: hypothetical protein CVU14_09065 [Bacteroidetes bacterium HGW-Bacteroidetes-9]|jgi:hypothetical protein|nr:MAG: hypothetical protein CVU14_09065 [Bacteroidetes bacterium HGW-Bacteroidetes-9]
MRLQNTLKYLLTTLLLNIVVIFSFAQDYNILDKFIATESNGKVFLNWVITSGQTCDGINILRSTNNINFIQIGEIPGVCGSSTTPQPYSFVDENPVFNSVNYYYLELGTTGYSEILEVEIIDTRIGGYQIRPNPVIDKAQIYIDNKKSENHELWLYNLSGAHISTLNTNNEYFEFDAANLSSGIYIFAIINLATSSITKGKIVVKH